MLGESDGNCHMADRARPDGMRQDWREGPGEAYDQNVQRTSITQSVLSRGTILGGPQRVSWETFDRRSPGHTISWEYKDGSLQDRSSVLAKEVMGKAAHAGCPHRERKS